MSSLAQHRHHLPSLHYQVCKRQPLLHPVRVYCSTSGPTTSTAAGTTKLQPNAKQLVIEPQPVPPRPTTINAATGPMDNNDPSLQSTWAHRAWVTAGCTTLLISLGESIKGAAASHMWAEPILAGWVGYFLADLGSGVYHWAIDNYGDGSTPIFGAQIEAFQGHHKWPWTITRRQFANNLHALARVVTFIVLPIGILCHGNHIAQGFIGMFAGCIMFSQQFHAWAHGTKSRLPPLVVALQEAGVLVSRTQHAAHHRPPYNNNYCIVSGVWNEFLDKQRVFEALEMVLFFQLGLRPRSWSEPASEWMEEVEIASPIEAQ